MTLGDTLPAAYSHGAIARLIPIANVHVGMQHTARCFRVNMCGSLGSPPDIIDSVNQFWW